MLLRTNGGYDLSHMDDAMLTVANWKHSQHGGLLREIVNVIERAGGAVPPGPPRYHGVRSEVYDWVALRTDGWVATPFGHIDAAGLWRGGASEEERAGAIKAVIDAEQLATADRELQIAYRRQPADPALVRSSRRLASETVPAW